MKDKIYYFQEKSNDILDLQDEFSPEEIGIYFILKAAYFKYSGELREDNLCQRCKFFGDKNKLAAVSKKIFTTAEGLLINNSWLSEINDIRVRSEKRRLAANERWSNEDKKPKKTQSKPKTTQWVPPSLQEVSDYCQERKNSVNPEKWIAHYQSNGWKVGKNSMKDWKAAVRTWEGNSFDTQAKQSSQSNQTSYLDYLNGGKNGSV